MPRGPRIEDPDVVHHVTANAASGGLLFVDEFDRLLYLELLAEQVRERGWSVQTYCQMSNHVHVLVRTPGADLAAGFKLVNERFARAFNRRRGRRGHVFGERFANRLVLTDRHFAACLRYIARNPVGVLCRQAQHWPWSAHAALAGLVEPPSFLDVSRTLSYLGEDVEAGRRAYTSLVAKTDEDLLSELAERWPQVWIAVAVDEYRVTIQAIADHLRVHISTAYERLAAARKLQDE